MPIFNETFADISQDQHFRMGTFEGLEHKCRGNLGYTFTPSGNFELSNTQSKFGSTSASFDGTNSYFQIQPNIKGWNNWDFINSTDFRTGGTIEFWVWPDSTQTSPGGCIFDLVQSISMDITDSQGSSQSTNNANDQSGGRLCFKNRNYGDSDARGKIIADTDELVTFDDWNHVAFTWTYYTITFYLNGNKIGSYPTNVSNGDADEWGDREWDLPTGTGTNQRNTFPANPVQQYRWTWGRSEYNTQRNYFKGYIDEIRISKSLRYQTTFTPPTSAFTDDNNTILLMHFNGTDGDTTLEDDDSVYGTRYNSNGERIVNCGFQPGLVWIHHPGRGGANESRLHSYAIDTANSNAYLRLNRTEVDVPNRSDNYNISDWTSTGFVLGNTWEDNGISNYYNRSDNDGYNSKMTYIAWKLDQDKDNPVTNTEGSVNTTNWSSEESGFAICKWSLTGGNTTSETFGHELGGKPFMMLHKNISEDEIWNTYVSNDLYPDQVYTRRASGGRTSLFGTSSAADSEAWFNTEPTDSVFTGGFKTTTDGDHICLLFREVFGKSKLFTYNFRDDREFYLGFEPKWMIILASNRLYSYNFINGYYDSGSYWRNPDKLNPQYDYDNFGGFFENKASDMHWNVSTELINQNLGGYRQSLVDYYNNGRDSTRINYRDGKLYMSSSDGAFNHAFVYVAGLRNESTQSGQISTGKVAIGGSF